MYQQGGITLKDIRAGKTEKGYARMATSNSVILMFLSTLDAYQNAERNQRILTAEGQANRQFKQEDPMGYVEQRLRASRARYPERYEVNKARAQKYLNRLFMRSSTSTEHFLQQKNP
ncbi:MAG: hypothetical protein M1405_01965 [Patescibacteria group bacterium]|nr:hypothetical protein [Patescibacteria group bacterium]